MKQSLLEKIRCFLFPTFFERCCYYTDDFYFRVPVRLAGRRHKKKAREKILIFDGKLFSDFFFFREIEKEGGGHVNVMSRKCPFEYSL